MLRDTIDTITAFALAPALIVTALSLPAWMIFRKRVQWHRWEYIVPAFLVLASILLVPLISLALPNAEWSWRSLSNAALEVLVACILAVLIPWLRVLVPVSSRRASLQFALGTLLAGMVLLALLWIAMPPLPE
ncbi:MAG: hypothetical protein WC353_01760 [Candidatus Peribacter sp.]|jgi:Kef-type K+ transport system membrane component KefB